MSWLVIVSSREDVLLRGKRERGVAGGSLAAWQAGANLNLPNVATAMSRLKTEVTLSVAWYQVPLWQVGT